MAEDVNSVARSHFPAKVAQVCLASESRVCEHKRKAIECFWYSSIRRRLDYAQYDVFWQEKVVAGGFVLGLVKHHNF